MGKQDRMESAALLFVEGYDFDQVLGTMGITAKTLKSYMNDPSWERLVEEAREPIIEGLRGKALSVIMKAIGEGDEATAKWFLERTTRTFSSDAKTRREAQADRTQTRVLDTESRREEELEAEGQESIEQMAERWRASNGKR